MIEPGKLNKLRVVKHVDFGIYLDGFEYGEILMPRRYVPSDCKDGDEIEVFIYFDSEDRIIATTEIPLAMVGDFAALKVVSVNNTGAFLDIGLQKDLLVPFREQPRQMQEGEIHLVRVYIDERTNRLVASARLSRFLSNAVPAYKEGQEVDILICNPTDLGYNAIINNSHMGLLYKGEVFRTMEIGERTKGYIKKMREDGRIDLILHKPGYEKAVDLSTLILNKLKTSGGFIAITDRTHPEIIYQMFSVSKKTFKKAIGALYKSKRIRIEEKGIRSVARMD